MGVPKLWDVLQPASQSRSLAHLAVVDGFEKNESGRRALRIGIDASLWFQHAYSSKGGANPEIRMLFFRLCALSELPVLPLFVFDGRERPKVKRGSRLGKSGSHILTKGMKTMLDCFGMEWRMALGEAEAELAYLNHAGVIDVVMTDDNDALIFGAKAIIRNSSLKLTGNGKDPARNAEGKASDHHVKVFTADAIRTHPNVRLTRGGMILFALLSGGDYNDGVKGCGADISHGLARCGFGDTLLEAYDSDLNGSAHFRSTFLPRWRTEVNQELHTNAHGFFSRRHPSLNLPLDFPDNAVLEAYADPICSGRGRGGGARGGGHAPALPVAASTLMRDRGNLDLARIATFCEDHFDEWGHRSAILKRFRTLLWDSAVMNVLRRAALEVDEEERSKRVAAGRTDLVVRGPLRPSITDAVGTPESLVKKYLNPTKQVVDRYAAAFVNQGILRQEASSASCQADAHPLIMQIAGSRKHVSTDYMPEYRVAIDPSQLVRLTQRGIKGKHPETGIASSFSPQNQLQSNPWNLPDEDGIYGGATRGITGGRARETTTSATEKSPPDPCSVMRVWIAASMIQQVHPRLAADFEAAEEEKKARKAGRGTGRKRRATARDISDQEIDEEHPRSPASQPLPPRKRVRTEAPQSTPSQALAPAGPSQNRPSESGTHRRAKNVGMLMDDPPRSPNGFLFTFPDPDDPDMVVWEDQQDQQDALESLSSGVGRLRGDSDRQGGGVPSVADDDDDEDQDAQETEGLARFDAMFDRILGIAPSLQGKGKIKASVSRKRPRESASAAIEGSQKAKRPRKATSTLAQSPSTAPLHNSTATKYNISASPQSQKEPFAVSSNQSSASHPRARFSGSDGFLAGVDVFFDLT
ncbi:hypothetical protein PHLCEN_2v5247 [Hermanssonia centrifuga]|uniref:XPG-I domain-containing protein n=1 Tax=Hermanssonia centrifuga TaxID=98765 RepID=A0A2R6P8K7_9APHY|nr:hypothetical protein PHLCEN_2v5247 [Hermanssonia centrifuga]